MASSGALRSTAQYNSANNGSVYWEFSWTSKPTTTPGKTEVYWELNFERSNKQSKDGWMSSICNLYINNETHSFSGRIYWKNNPQKSGSFTIDHNNSGEGSFEVTLDVNKIFDVLYSSDKETFYLDPNYPYKPCSWSDGATAWFVDKDGKNISYIAPDTDLKIKWNGIGANQGTNNSIIGYKCGYKIGNWNSFDNGSPLDMSLENMNQPSSGYISGLFEKVSDPHNRGQEIIPLIQIVGEKSNSGYFEGTPIYVNKIPIMPEVWRKNGNNWEPLVSNSTILVDSNIDSITFRALPGDSGEEESRKQTCRVDGWKNGGWTADYIVNSTEYNENGKTYFEFKITPTLQTTSYSFYTNDLADASAPLVVSIKQVADVGIDIDVTKGEKNSFALKINTTIRDNNIQVGGQSKIIGLSGMTCKLTISDNQNTNVLVTQYHPTTEGCYFEIADIRTLIQTISFERGVRLTAKVTCNDGVKDFFNSKEIDFSSFPTLNFSTDIINTTYFENKINFKTTEQTTLEIGYNQISLIFENKDNVATCSLLTADGGESSGGDSGYFWGTWETPINNSNSGEVIKIVGYQLHYTPTSYNSKVFKFDSKTFQRYNYFYLDNFYIPNAPIKVYDKQGSYTFSYRITPSVESVNNQIREKRLILKYKDAIEEIEFNPAESSTNDTIDFIIAPKDQDLFGDILYGEEIEAEAYVLYRTFSGREVSTASKKIIISFDPQIKFSSFSTSENYNYIKEGPINFTSTITGYKNEIFNFYFLIEYKKENGWKTIYETKVFDGDEISGEGVVSFDSDEINFEGTIGPISKKTVLTVRPVLGIKYDDGTQFYYGQEKTTEINLYRHTSPTAYFTSIVYESSYLKGTIKITDYGYDETIIQGNSIGKISKLELYSPDTEKTLTVDQPVIENDIISFKIEATNFFIPEGSTQSKDYILIAPKLTSQYWTLIDNKTKKAETEKSTTDDMLNYKIVYNTLPTVAYRKNHVGFNTNNPDDYRTIETEESDVAMVVCEYQGRNKVIFTSTSADSPKKICFNLAEGSVIGLTIDGGSW